MLPEEANTMPTKGFGAAADQQVNFSLNGNYQGKMRPRVLAGEQSRSSEAVQVHDYRTLFFTRAANVAFEVRIRFINVKQ